MRERTIQFFEIVLEKGGEQVRCEQFDFPRALGGMALGSLDERMWDGPEQTLIGTVMPVEEVDYLLLHRVKDGGEWLSVIDLATGDWHELESRAGQGYLDTTAVAFLPYGNVVALMQGATSAPRAPCR